MFRNDSIVSDVKSNEIMGWLCIKDEHENIINNSSKIISILYFFKEEQTSAMLKLSQELDSENFKIFMKNILSLYPLSKHLVFAILEDIPDPKNMSVKDILVMYEKIDGTLEDKRRLIEQKIRNTDVNSKLEKIKENVDRYTDMKNSKLEELKQIKELGSSEKALEKEIKQLEQDINKLQKDFTKDAMIEQKNELILTRNKLNKEKEEFEKDKNELVKLQFELQEVTTNDTLYSDALASINRLAKSLSKGDE